MTAPGRTGGLSLDFDGFRRLAGEGTIVPIYAELLVDRDTPVSAFLKIGRGPNTFLLESMEGGEKWGRYSIIGGEARSVFTLEGGVQRLVRADGVKIARRTEGPPLALLSETIAADRSASVPGLPRFSGGAIGYGAYDLVRHFERLGDPPPDDLGLPTAAFVFFDSLVIFDNLRHTVKIVANARIRDDLKGAYREAVETIDRLRSRLAAPTPIAPAPVRARTVEFESAMGRERYLRSVDVIRDYIRAGDVFQTVLAHRLSAPTEVDPFDAYRALRVLNPSPYMFFLDFGEFQLAGASPEVLVRVEDRVAEVRPIAGTRPRGRTPSEDRALEADLLADDKERSEHVMLVDLGRNDLGRACLYDTVETGEFMVVERYSHVMHIVSNVTGTLRPDASTVDVLAACFPAGTLSGAPKVRAMEIIDELETARRGIYGGAVGYLDTHGNMDTCIAIRTILFKDGVAHVGAGAGIVADSQPEREWEETMAKSRSATEAVRLAERGLDLGGGA